MAQKKPISFSDYKKLIRFSYNDMCRYLDLINQSICAEAERQIAEQAVEIATKSLLGDADVAYIMDPEEFRKRAMSVRGISGRLADLILEALTKDDKDGVLERSSESN